MNRVILGYFGLFWVISMIYHAEAYTGYFGISNIFQSIFVIFRVIWGGIQHVPNQNDILFIGIFGYF